MKTCPSILQCSYSNFEPVKEQIQKFKKQHEYNPLSIRKSTIGLGLFVTANIEKNTLIGVYTGTVGTHFDSDAHSDSLFELGWFKEN